MTPVDLAERALVDELEQDHARPLVQHQLARGPVGLVLVPLLRLFDVVETYLGRVLRERGYLIVDACKRIRRRPLRVGPGYGFGRAISELSLAVVVLCEVCRVGRPLLIVQLVVFLEYVV